MNQKTKNSIDNNKPFIQFGKHSSQIDNAFNNFDIRENWYDFHWNHNKYFWMSNQQISGLQDPTSPQDAATKIYVDREIEKVKTLLGVKLNKNGNSK